MCEHSQNLSESSISFLLLYINQLFVVQCYYNGINQQNYLLLFGHVIICLTIIVLHALRWPVRTISFNHTGEYIALASEDLFIDIVCIGSLFTWE